MNEGGVWERERVLSDDELHWGLRLLKTEYDWVKKQVLRDFDENCFQLVSGYSFCKWVVISFEYKPSTFVFYTSVTDIPITKDDNHVSQIAFWNVVVNDGCLSIFQSWKHAIPFYSCEFVAFNVEVEMPSKGDSIYTKKYEDTKVDRMLSHDIRTQPFPFLQLKGCDDP